MNYKMDYSLNCSSLDCPSLNGSSLNNDLMYLELYDKILKLEKNTINMLELIDKQTNIIDFMITTSITNNRIQTRINNDIIIIFVIILIILLYLFSFIKQKR